MVTHHGKWLIHRRPEKGLLASMWEFPSSLGRGKAGRQKACEMLQDLGLTIAIDDKALTKVKHVFSHKIWQLTVYAGTVVSSTLVEKEDWQWLPCADYTTVPWAGPHGKFTAL